MGIYLQKKIEAPKSRKRKKSFKLTRQPKRKPGDLTDCLPSSPKKIQKDLIKEYGMKVTLKEIKEALKKPKKNRHLIYKTIPA